MLRYCSFAFFFIFPLSHTAEQFKAALDQLRLNYTTTGQHDHEKKFGSSGVLAIDQSPTVPMRVDVREDSVVNSEGANSSVHVRPLQAVSASLPQSEETLIAADSANSKKGVVSGSDGTGREVGRKETSPSGHVC